MHLDLKSPNILLAQDGTAKIADVGLSRMFTARSLPVAKVTAAAWLESGFAHDCMRSANICRVKRPHNNAPAYAV